MGKISIENLVLFILLIVVIVGLMYIFSSKTSVPEQQLVASSTATSSGQSGASTPSSKTPVSSTAPVSKSTITEERALYTSKGLYSQLSGCIGYPGSLNMQQGQKFMLENASQIKADVTVKTQYFMIPAKNFVIVTAIDSGYYDVVCNGTNALKLQVRPK